MATIKWPLFSHYAPQVYGVGIGTNGFMYTIQGSKRSSLPFSVTAQKAGVNNAGAPYTVVLLGHCCNLFAAQALALWHANS